MVFWRIKYPTQEEASQENWFYSFFIIGFFIKLKKPATLLMRVRKRTNIETAIISSFLTPKEENIITSAASRVPTPSTEKGNRETRLPTAKTEEKNRKDI